MKHRRAMAWPLFTRRRAMGAIAVAPVAWRARADIGAADDAPDDTTPVDLAASGGGPGVADNTPPLRAALARLAGRGGGTLFIGAGTFGFASASLTQAGIALPAGITIRGAGPGRTILQVTGGTACNLFVATDRSGIAFEALSMVGNGIAPDAGAYGSGAAIRWLLSPGATATATGFTMRDVHLENFRGPYWVDIENDSAPGRRLAMRAVVLERVTFASRPGNSIAPSDVRLNASAIAINGYSGEISGVRVTGLTGDARHIKTGIILYNQVTDAVLDAVTVIDAGAEGATDDAGAYAIQLYDSNYRMYAVTVSNAVIRGARSVGIYVAGGRGITIVEPRISGQTDTRAGTLPKGAVVFNGTRDWQLRGGELEGNWRDLDIVAPPRGSPSAPERVGGSVSGVRAQGSETGISIRYAAGHVARGIAFRDCRWRTRTRTVLVQNSGRPVVAGPRGGGYVDDIVFESCRFEAGDGHRAMDLWVDSGSPAGGYLIARCTLIGSNPLFARDQTGALRLDGCTVGDLGTLDGAAAATLVGCPELDLSDTIFRSPGRDGIGIDLGGSEGSVRGLRFEDCTRVLPARALPRQLGRAQPSFASRAAQQVQNLEPAAGEYEAWTCRGGTDWTGMSRRR